MTLLPGLRLSAAAACLTLAACGASVNPTGAKALEATPRELHCAPDVAGGATAALADPQAGCATAARAS